MPAKRKSLDGLDALQEEVDKAYEKAKLIKLGLSRSRARVVVLEDALQKLYNVVHHGSQSAERAKEKDPEDQFVKGWLSTARGFAGKFDSACFRIGLKPIIMEEDETDA